MGNLFLILEFVFTAGIGYMIIHHAKKNKKKELELLLEGKANRKDIYKKYDQSFLIGSVFMGIGFIRFATQLLS